MWYIVLAVWLFLGGGALALHVKAGLGRGESVYSEDVWGMIQAVLSGPIGLALVIHQEPRIVLIKGYQTPEGVWPGRTPREISDRVLFLQDKISMLENGTGAEFEDTPMTDKLSYRAVMRKELITLQWVTKCERRGDMS